jgi:hypothetical protein
VKSWICQRRQVVNGSDQIIINATLVKETICNQPAVNQTYCSGGIEEAQ